MTYTFEFSVEFSKTYAGLPIADLDKIDAFTTDYETYGLADLTKYPGKLRFSWRKLLRSDPKYRFAYGNDLWHYHVGIPTFRPSLSGSYSTSDWLLHFQWPNWKANGPHIRIVDLLPHSNYRGVFNLPSPRALP